MHYLSKFAFGLTVFWYKTFTFHDALDSPLHCFLLNILFQLKICHIKEVKWVATGNSYWFWGLCMNSFSINQKMSPYLEPWKYNKEHIRLCLHGCFTYIHYVLHSQLSFNFREYGFSEYSKNMDKQRVNLALMAVVAKICGGHMRTPPIWSWPSVLLT